VLYEARRKVRIQYNQNPESLDVVGLPILTAFALLEIVLSEIAVEQFFYYIMLEDGSRSRHRE
jgi:hypothetical protein